MPTPARLAMAATLGWLRMAKGVITVAKEHTASALRSQSVKLIVLLANINTNYEAIGRLLSLIKTTAKTTGLLSLGR
jgi:hypothetical protein